MKHLQTKKIYLVALVFVPDDAPQFKKYQHSIKDKIHYITKFCSDMKKKFPGARYVNFYYKHTQKFKERIYLE